MTSAEMASWMAYDLVEPFGQRRADDGFRGLMALIASANGAKDVTPADFLKPWQPAPAPLSVDAQVAALAGFFDKLAEPKGD